MAKDVHVVKTVEIPDGVEVEIAGSTVKVKGPKGEIVRTLPVPRGVFLRKEENHVIVETYFANSRRRAIIGTLAAHIKNMIIGVTKGYRYKLKIIFSHFPMNVKVEGDKVVISNFIGEKAPRIAKILPGVNVRIDKKNNDVIVEGIDIEKVGQTAANIEFATKIKDKDRRKFMDGIYIYEKGVAEQ